MLRETLVVFLLTSWLTGCAILSGAGPGLEACAGFKPFRLKDPVVRGTFEWDRSINLGVFEHLIEPDRDILTTSLAGQILAHNDFYRKVCPK
jgi:hypothetical protein